MKFKNIIPFVAGLIILQSCSTPKNDILWVGGFKTECDSGAGKSECMLVHKGEELNVENWDNFYSNIEGIEYEEGFMKKIEVKKEELQAKDVPADASSLKYTLVKEIEKKMDPRAALSGNWALATINGGNINKMIVIPTLNIDLSKMLISGNGGCNLYSASIEKLTSNEILIQESLGTLMECANDNIELKYHKTLSSVKAYVVNNRILSLSDKDGNVILSYIRVEAPKSNQALLGDWKNIRINGEAFENEITPTIAFNLDEMSVNGTDGCNVYGGSITSLSTSDLTLGALYSTKKMCHEMKVPDRFVKSISQVEGYKIKGKELILLDKEGNELLAFTK